MPTLPENAPLRLYRLPPGAAIPERLQPDWELGSDRLLCSIGDAESLLWEAPRALVIERRYCLAHMARPNRPVAVAVMRALLDPRGVPLAWWQRATASDSALISGPASLPCLAAHQALYGVEAAGAPPWETVHRLCSEQFAADLAALAGGPAPSAAEPQQGAPAAPHARRRTVAAAVS